jgi:hypothetical protein
MKKLIPGILLLFLFLNSKISVSNCQSDSTVIHFAEINDDGQLTKTYEKTIYHIDSGIFDHCTYSFINDTWTLNSCNTGFYSDVVKTYNINGQLVEELTRQGSLNGWVPVAAHRFSYNSHDLIKKECSLSFNGASWDTMMVKNWIYDSNENLKECFSKKLINGILEYDKRFIYLIVSGKKVSVTFQHGPVWSNDSMFTFNYSGSVRTGINYFKWNPNNTTWEFKAQATYDSSQSYSVKISFIDTIFNGYKNRIDTNFMVVDTLENCLSRSDLKIENYSSGNYTLKVYSYINGSYLLTRDLGAMIWSYIEPGTNEEIIEIDYACTGPNTYYVYDINSQLLSIDDYSRCVMPHHTGYSYNYDSGGFMNESFYTYETNFHDRLDHHLYYHTNGNTIMLYDPFRKSEKVCNDTVHPSLTLAGGCGPYAIQWSPVNGLSNATILNPQIILSDSITYSITVTDQNGITASYEYKLVPLTAKIHINSTCTPDSWGTLSINTNADQANYYSSWYKEGDLNSVFQQQYHYNQLGSYYAVVHDYNIGCHIYSDTVHIQTDPTVYHIINDFYNGHPYLLPDGNYADSAGTYNCLFSSTTGCDSIVTVNLSIHTFIENIVNDKIELFPVPVTGFLNIKTDLEDADIVLTNLLGNIIIKKQITSVDKIDMNFLSPGIYIVVVYQKEKWITRKLVEKL